MVMEWPLRLSELPEAKANGAIFRDDGPDVNECTLKTI
jgi:hypothetical protein